MSVQPDEQHAPPDPTPRNGRAASRLLPDGALKDSLRDTRDRVQETLKWFRPGMRVKRWLFVALFGIAVLVAGVDLMFLMQLADLGDRLNELMYRAFGVSLHDYGALRQLTYQVLIGFPTAVLGLLLFIYGMWNMLASVTSAVIPTGNQPIADVGFRREPTGKSLWFCCVPILVAAGACGRRHRIGATGIRRHVQGRGVARPLGRDSHPCPSRRRRGRATEQGFVLGLGTSACPGRVVHYLATATPIAVRERPTGTRRALLRL